MKYVNEETIREAALESLGEAHQELFWTLEHLRDELDGLPAADDDDAAAIDRGMPFTLDGVAE